MSRYELARTGLKTADVEKMLDMYAVHGTHREQLLALAREATEKGWWEAYSDTLPADYAAFIGLEAEARIMSAVAGRGDTRIAADQGVREADHYRSAEG